MRPSTDTCWPRSTLRDYLTGWISTEQMAELEAHLESCAHCEQTLHALEAESDTLCELLKQQAVLPASLLEAANTTESPKQVLGHPETSASAEAVVAYAIERAAQTGPAQSTPHVLENFPKQLGPYELVKPLGSGGMGAVFLAEHRTLRKRVAIKLLPAKAFRNDLYAARFQREIRAVGQLQHPAVVNATDAGEQAGAHFLVMEYVDGLDLSRVARSQGPLDIAEACEIMRAVALGLSHAHAGGIVHRDVKPSNIMLSQNGEVKILDFGLAQVSLWDDASAELTTVGQLMGTLDYMAPEQAENPNAVDYRADLYAIGATLFRLLCGRPPLAAAPDLSPMTKLRLLYEHPAPSLATLRTDAPAELVQLTAALLDRDPDRRPGSAAHVAETLSPFARGAKLVELLQRSREAMEEPASDHQLSNNRLLASRLAAEETQVPPAATRAASATGIGWRGWSVMGKLTAAALVPLSLAAVILLTLELQKGELIIDSAGASVRVELLKDGQFYEKVMVTPGANVTRVYAGQYQIFIDEGIDNFQLDQQSVTLQRGEVVVVRLTERQAAATEDLTGSTVAIAAPQTLLIPPPSTAQIEPGDLLEVVYLADASLNREVVVMADYTVKLPLLGVVSVAERNPQQFESELKGLYKSYLNPAELEVYRSRPMGVQQPAKGDAQVSAPTPTLPSEEPLVFDGKTLHEWLSIVARERSAQKVTQALDAIEALVDEDSSPMIVAKLLEVLPEVSRIENQGRNIQTAIWNVIRTCQPNHCAFWEFVCHQLDTGNVNVAEQFLRYETVPFLLIDEVLSNNTQALEPFSKWWLGVLSAGPQHRLFPNVLKLTRDALNTTQLKPLIENEKFLSSLADNDNLGTEFWLTQAPLASWSLELCRIVQGKAVQALRDANSDLSLMTRAALALEILRKNSSATSPEARDWEDVVSNVVRVLKAARDHGRMLDEVNVSTTFWDALPFKTTGFIRFTVYYTEPVPSNSISTLPYLELLQFLSEYGASTDAAELAKSTAGDLWNANTRWVANMYGNNWQSQLRFVPTVLTYDSTTQLRDRDAWSLLLLIYALEQLAEDDQYLEGIRVRIDFSKADKDGDGVVSSQELPEADVDGDGTVSFDEFLQAPPALQPNPSQPSRSGVASLEWAKRQIGKYDQDGDGRLSRSEMDKMIIRPTGADTDGDGYVTANEYAEFRQK